jgi:DNA-binding beta-propeller fold protein YncE
MRRIHSGRSLSLVCVAVVAALLGGAGSALLGLCGPFTDTANDAFCPFILEIYYLGITSGTSATTYDPTSNVNRTQMAAFLSRSVDDVLKRGSRRAALQQFWTTQDAAAVGVTTVGTVPRLLQSDGLDIWVANSGSNSVSRVRGSDGRLLETWTGATSANGVLVAMGRVFVTGLTSPGNLYRIDPSQTAGAVTTVASNLGNTPLGIAFDGSRIWTANQGSSVSIVTPGAAIPWTVTTVTTGFNEPFGILYDSANVWVTDDSANTLLKLDSTGAVLQTVTVGAFPFFPAFDGGSIWVPNANSNSVSVVRASNGTVLQTLTGNGLNSPRAAAFDGQRVLVTNVLANSISLWKAADLTPLGTLSTGASTNPFGACSDGINFWITLNNTNQLARF